VWAVGKPSCTSKAMSACGGAGTAWSSGTKIVSEYKP
jgi:hypothetical protein